MNEKISDAEFKRAQEIGEAFFDAIRPAEKGTVVWYAINLVLISWVRNALDKYTVTLPEIRTSLIDLVCQVCQTIEKQEKEEKEEKNEQKVIVN